MKAVIVELKNGYAAALTDDGCIKKLQNKDYAIGQVIEMKARNIKKVAIWAASAAAAVLLCSTTVWAYVSPYTYVSLDVNPSIEFSVNRFGRVISASAVNGDGAEIIKDLNLNHKSIVQAVCETVRQIEKAGYFSGSEPGGVVVSTSGADAKAAENLADEIKDAVVVTTQDAENDVEVESESVGLERVQQARELGVTPGKLNLVEKLKANAADPGSIDINEWLKRPVKDIMKATKEYRKSHKQEHDDLAPGSSGPLTPGASGELTPGFSEPLRPGESEAIANHEKDGRSGDASSGKEHGKNSSSAVSSEKVNGKSGDNGNGKTENIGKDEGNGKTEGNGNDDDKNTGNAGGNDNGNNDDKNTGNTGGNGNAGGKKDK